MKRKVTCIVLALVLCMSITMPTVATDTSEPAFMPGVTVNIINANDLTATMTNVYERMGGAMSTYFYYFTPEGSISFNRDVYISNGIADNLIESILRAGEIHSVSDLWAEYSVPYIIIIGGKSVSYSEYSIALENAPYDETGEFRVIEGGCSFITFYIGDGRAALARDISYDEASESLRQFFIEHWIVNDASSPEPTPSSPEPQTVSPTASTVYVNGEEKAFEAYNIDGYNYFKLRDLAYVLDGTEKQFEVGYDNDTKAIALTSGEPYTAVGGEMEQGDGESKNAVPTPSTIYLDGEVLDLVVYNIGGNNFFKLRDLMEAIDVYVGYDNDTKAITLDTSEGYVAE